MDIARSAYDLGGATKTRGPWKQLFKRAQSPSGEEIERNRRARSAKLRVAERRNADTEGRDSDRGNTEGKFKKVGKKQQEKMRKKKEECGEEDQ